MRTVLASLPLVAQKSNMLKPFVGLQHRQTADKHSQTADEHSQTADKHSQTAAEHSQIAEEHSHSSRALPDERSQTADEHLQTAGCSLRPLTSAPRPLKYAGSGKK